MSAHCRQCGARSTIWMPACVFCGNPVSSCSIPAVRPEPQIRNAAFDGTCTERGAAPKKAGWMEVLRLFLLRLFRRAALTRP